MRHQNDIVDANRILTQRRNNFTFIMNLSLFYIYLQQERKYRDYGQTDHNFLFYLTQAKMSSNQELNVLRVRDIHFISAVLSLLLVRIGSWFEIVQTDFHQWHIILYKPAWL